MKRQKILTNWGFFETSTDFGNVISFEIQKRDELNNFIRLKEVNLANELKNVFQTKEEYEKYRDILNLYTIPDSEKNDQTSEQKSLLGLICLQIAQSLDKYHEIEEDSGNGRINWGFNIYLISHSEWSTAFEGMNEDFIEEKFKELSKIFEEKFEIKFKVLQCNYKIDETKFIRIMLQIFP